ncbi:MAG: ribosome biogenesis GTPase Der [Holosporales bacterium]|jgi:GTP-binding protein|nr:ribosome biogenesis GTPase Der [Holosporales bacterium]
MLVFTKFSNSRVVILGRTNVGKSTLFNRLISRREAIVFDRPGVTRDLREKDVVLLGSIQACIVDTPGLFDTVAFGGQRDLVQHVDSELNRIIGATALMLFVLDGVSGITSIDREIAQFIRRSGKPVIAVVNKADCNGTDAVCYEAAELGFDLILKVSAEHGAGIDSLLEKMSDFLPAIPSSPNTEQAGQHDDARAIRLAIVGRPNAGKSALVNAMVGQSRRLVGDFAGLTRESSELEFEFARRRIKVVDTPGLRRKSKMADTLDMVVDSNGRNAYKSADAVIVVVDATSLVSGEVESYDLKIAADVVKEGKPVIIAFNKCDITPFNQNDTPEFLKRNFRTSFAQLKGIPFLFVSALHRTNIGKMLRLALSMYDKHNSRIKTSGLNSWLRDMCQGGWLQNCAARFNLKYITQVDANPPTFLIFVSNGASMRDSQRRFVINSLRARFELNDVAIRVLFRESSERRRYKGVSCQSHKVSS